MSWNKKFKQGILLLVCTLTLAGSVLVWGDAKTEASTEPAAVSINGKAGMIASLERTESNALDMAQVASVSIERAETELVTVAPKSEAQATDEEPQAALEEGADKEKAEKSEENVKSKEKAESEKNTENQDKAENKENTENKEDAENRESTEDKEHVENKEDAVEPSEDANAQEASEETEKKPLTKTEKEWQDKVMADVDDSLTIRAKGKADAKIVGKLYPTSVATVVKEGETWTKIESGSVKGYVKNKYLLFGQDAYENAKKVCKTYAYVKTDGLRVRSKADEDAKVLATADKGDKLLYNSKAKKVDDWVAVKVKAGKGYVAADFVKVKLGTTKAVSIEEIEAQKAKEDAAKATLKKQNAATSSDTTLLAAIIQCEAGCECYTGKVAVGAVVLNRVRSSRFPNSISGVIYQRGQFSPVGNGALARVLASGNISSACRQAAADALAGADPTGGKLFFHRANGSRGLIIGNHVFY